MEKMKITVCILTKNNARTIEKCLNALCDKNLKPLAELPGACLPDGREKSEGFAFISPIDEILLLDTGSTDETLDIVTRFPHVRVFHQDGIENFGAARKFISSFAKNDWLLHIDSDEYLSKEFFEELNRLDFDANTVYEISFRMFYRGRQLPCFDTSSRRFYNRAVTSWDNRAVHETINLHKGMKLGRIKALIEHHSCDCCDQLIQKAQNYSTLFADQFMGKKTAARWSAALHGAWAFFRFYFLKRNIFHGHA